MLTFGISRATKEAKGGEPYTLLRLKICLSSDFKWLQGIHKALIHLEVCY